MKRISRTGKILIGIVLVLVAARVALPYVLKHYINGVLKNDIAGYTGHIEDLDLSLYRGAYQIQGFELSRVNNAIPVPFIQIEDSDLSIAWRPLFRGRVVGKVHLDRARLNFVNGPSEAQTQTGTEGEGWQDTLDKIFPLEIEELRITHSQVHYQDFHTKPEVDIFLHETELLATNLRNTTKHTDELVSTVDFTSKIKDEGKIKLKGSVNILRDPLSFDYNLAATEIDLTRFNDLFRAYLGVDVAKGRFDIFSEAASKQGVVKGYIKPMLTNVNVLSKRERDNLLKVEVGEVWGSLVNLIARRYSRDQMAAKVSFDGDLSDPDIKVWPAVKSLISHAFNRTLEPQIDGSINIYSLNQKPIKKKAKPEVDAPTVSEPIKGR